MATILSSIQPAATLLSAIIAVFGVMVTLNSNAEALKKARESETASIIIAAKSDITSIVIALDRTEVVEQFIKVRNGSADKPTPWVSAPGEENYFQLFGAIAPQIGRLGPELAREIVRFYTFLRLSRDAAKRFSDANEKSGLSDEDKKVYIKNVLIAIDEVLIAAIKIITYPKSTDELVNEAIKIINEAIYEAKAKKIIADSISIDELENEVIKIIKESKGKSENKGIKIIDDSTSKQDEHEILKLLILLKRVKDELPQSLPAGSR